MTEDYLVRFIQCLRWRNCPKAFLSSCIPYLQFHLLSIDHYCPNFEIDTYRCNVCSYRFSDIN